mmetsp:Transcript_34962/g.81809  ORF Transcript_34962/g.81809 Transcript_34962/m.81809 type:complete len:274 (+) Transcript_34962:77-898(+)
MSLAHVVSATTKCSFGPFGCETSSKSIKFEVPLVQRFEKSLLSMTPRSSVRSTMAIVWLGRSHERCIPAQVLLQLREVIGKLLEDHDDVHAQEPPFCHQVVLLRDAAWSNIVRATQGTHSKVVKVLVAIPRGQASTMGDSACLPRLQHLHQHSLVHFVVAQGGPSTCNWITEHNACDEFRAEIVIFHITLHHGEGVGVDKLGSLVAMHPLVLALRATPIHLEQAIRSRCTPLVLPRGFLADVGASKVVQMNPQNRLSARCWGRKVLRVADTLL